MQIISPKSVKNSLVTSSTFLRDDLISKKKERKRSFNFLFQFPPVGSTKIYFFLLKKLLTSLVDSEYWNEK